MRSTCLPRRGVYCTASGICLNVRDKATLVIQRADISNAEPQQLGKPQTTADEGRAKSLVQPPADPRLKDGREESDAWQWSPGNCHAIQAKPELRPHRKCRDLDFCIASQC